MKELSRMLNAMRLLAGSLSTASFKENDPLKARKVHRQDCGQQTRSGWNQPNSHCSSLAAVSSKHTHSSPSAAALQVPTPGAASPSCRLKSIVHKAPTQQTTRRH